MHEDSSRVHGRSHLLAISNPNHSSSLHLRIFSQPRLAEPSFDLSPEALELSPTDRDALFLGAMVMRHDAGALSIWCDQASHSSLQASLLSPMPFEGSRIGLGPTVRWNLSYIIYKQHLLFSTACPSSSTPVCPVLMIMTRGRVRPGPPPAAAAAAAVHARAACMLPCAVIMTGCFSNRFEQSLLASNRVEF